jgi:hypothetical protein
MFTLQTSFKPLLLGLGGGGGKSVSRGDCEQQGGKHLPYYVKEFGLWSVEEAWREVLNCKGTRLYNDFVRNKCTIFVELITQVR